MDCEPIIELRRVDEVSLPIEPIVERCSICCDKFLHPIKLQCNHKFCQSCNVEWHRKCIITSLYLSCPLCRQVDRRWGR